MDSITAIAQQVNSWFDRALGHEHNWFNVVLGIARRKTGGKITSRSVDVAIDVCNELIMSLHKKEDNFAIGVAAIELKKEVLHFFGHAAYLRVKRMVIDIARDKKKACYIEESRFYVNKFVTRGEDEELEIVDKRAKVNEDQEIAELSNMILDQLREMAAEAHDIRSRERLRVAILVAQKRMENPPCFPSLDDLCCMFPDIKRGRMNLILQDIQLAAKRALAK